MISKLGEVQSEKITRRSVLTAGAFTPMIAAARHREPDTRVFDVAKYGALGDGISLDTAAFQKAINAAAGVPEGAQVLVRGGHKYLIGTLQLKSNVDLHLGDGATLLASTHREDYRGGALIIANGAHNISVSGNGSIDGQAQEFMAHYDEQHEIWVPRDWRPKMFLLTTCRGIQIRDIGVANTAYWGIRMLGCDGIEIENVKIRSMLNIPNCDGIATDHCRNVALRKCHVTCGDDAIAIKSSRQAKDYGLSENIIVNNCVIETQSSGLKIGSETVGDIRDVRIENCEIRNSSRGLCIQLRDQGSISTIEFRNIKLTSRYFSDPWWGRGEPISFTAIPRTAGGAIGSIHNVRVVNVTANAENSVRVSGSAASRIRDVLLDSVAVTLNRWTSYPGRFYDDRPTSAQHDIESHNTPGFFISHASNITLQNCSVAWGKQIPDYFSYAVEARKVEHLGIERLKGHAAHPSSQKATSID